MEQMPQKQYVKQDQTMELKKGRQEEQCTEKDFFVCPMCHNDYEEVHALWCSCDGVGLNEIDDSKSGIMRFLLRNPNTCFVAKMKEKIVGVILVGQDGRRGYIYHLAVAEDCRGKGIAKELVTCAVHALESLGIQKAACVVFSNNEAGNCFWEKIGFTIRDDLIYRNKSVNN